MINLTGNATGMFECVYLFNTEGIRSVHPFLYSGVFSGVRFRYNLFDEMMRKLIIAGIVALVATLSGCFYFGPCLDGSGPVLSELREVGDFNSVTNTGSFDVYVIRADTFGVEVSAQENLVPIIETYVSGNTLIVKTENNSCYRSDLPVEVYVTMPEIQSLSLTGSGKVIADRVADTEVEISNAGSGLMEVDSVIAVRAILANSGSGSIGIGMVEGEKVIAVQSGSGTIFSGSIYGSSEINIRHSSSGRVTATIVDADQLDVVMSGSGRNELAGEAEVAEYSLNSSGRIDALDLMVTEVTATNTGSGNISLWATDLLDVTITGSGNIIYRGDPAISIRDTGSGSLRSY